MVSNLEISTKILNDLGFESASTTRIPKLLEKVKFMSGTAVRDAIIQSILLILNLNNQLMQSGGARNWNFLNIVISDGDDNSSKSSKSELTSLLNKMRSSIPSECCKNILVGVGLNRSAKRDYQQYADAGGNICQFIESDSGDLESIFDRLQANITLWRQTSIGVICTENEAYAFARSQIGSKITVTRKKFAVIFTLDISPSMEERTGWFTFNTKWKSLKRAVKKFLSHMESDDLVCCVMFCAEVYIVTKKEKEKGWCQIF